MSEFREEAQLPATISAQQARRAPVLFNILTIVAVLLPLPLMVFWLGASMIVYAMNRHHPDPMVAAYIQSAAVRLYAVAGAAVPVGTFFSLDVMPWLIYWAVAAVILIPLSIRDLIRIKNDHWQETNLER